VRKKSRDLFTPRVNGRNPLLDALEGKVNDSNVLLNCLDASTVVYYCKSIQDFFCTALNHIEGGMRFPSKMIIFTFLCTSCVTRWRGYGLQGRYRKVEIEVLMSDTSLLKASSLFARRRCAVRSDSRISRPVDAPSGLLSQQKMHTQWKVLSLLGIAQCINTTEKSDVFSV
jgi:hypothetical protein